MANLLDQQQNAEDDFLDNLLMEAFEDVSAVEFHDEEDIYEDGLRPVSILEFAESPDYLDMEGQLWPEVRQFLVDIENPVVREADMILGKGSGKSQLAKIFTLKGCYDLLILKHPQKHYGLTEDTPIYCGVVSISGKQAKDNIFAGVKSLAENSSCFKSTATMLEASTADELRFAKDIRYFCGHSNHTAFLGYATYRACMDEVNFMVDNNNRSVADQLYTALRGSLKTRFPTDYKLLAISSDNLPNSFMRAKLKEALKKHLASSTLTPSERLAAMNRRF